MSIPGNTDNWIKLNLATEIHLKDALLDILHNVHNDPAYIGFPKNQHQLYQRMVLFKQQHQQALRNVLKANQWNVLCPTAGLSNSVDWDITLIIVVIINNLGLPAPQGGWRQQLPQAGDNSKSAFVLLARWLRNDVKHGTTNDFQLQTRFNHLWAEIRKTLIGFHYGANKLQEFDDLETGTLKLYTAAIVLLIENKQKQIEIDFLNIKTKQGNDVQYLTNKLQSLEAKEQKDVQSLQSEQTQLTCQLQSLEAKGKIDVEALQNKQTQLAKNLLHFEENEENVISDLQIQLNNLNKVVISLTKTINVSEQRSSELSRSVTELVDLYNQGKEEQEKENTEVKIKLKDFDDLKRNFTEDNAKKDKSIEKLKQDVEKLERFKSSQSTVQGFKSAVNKYKKELQQNVLKKRFEKPFLGATGEAKLDDKNIEEAFVDLAIITGEGVDEKFLNSNREYHLQQVHLKKYPIQIQDLLKNEDELVIISGVPGIGKSSLVQKLALEWSRGRLWSGENGSPEVQLLLPIICRELNVMNGKENASSDEILESLFPDFFSNIEFKGNKNRNVFLIDGVDELRSIDDIQDKTRQPFVNMIYQLMKLASLRKNKCILVGRPRTTRMLQSFYEQNFHCQAKTVEVCGFNETSVKTYFSKQFENDQTLGYSIIEQIQASPVTDGLSRIPLYAWVITSIFKDNSFLEMPKTATELLLYSVLVFLRNQKEKQGTPKSNMSLSKLITDPKVLKYFKTLSTLSYRTLVRNEIIFEVREEIEKTVIDELESMGLLLKATRGESGVDFYQFQHFIFQELFSSVHVFTMKDRKEQIRIINDPTMRDSLPLMAGLEGILYGYVTKPNSLLQCFLKNLRVHSSWIQRIERIFFSESKQSIMDHLEQKWSKDLTWEDSTVKMDIFHVFVEAFYENQSTIANTDLLRGCHTIDLACEFHVSEFTFYRLCYFVYTLIQHGYPSLTFKDFGLSKNWMTFGWEKLLVIMCRCESLALFGTEIFSDELFSHLISNFNEKLPNVPLKEINIYLDDHPFSKLPDYFLPCLHHLEILEIENITVDADNKSNIQFALLQISDSISRHKNLKQLTLSNCGLTDDMFSVMLPALHKLTYLNVRWNELSQLSLCRLLSQLKPSSSLKQIHFYDNELQDEPIEEINSLHFNYAVTVEELTISQRNESKETLTQIIPIILRMVNRLRLYDHYSHLPLLLATLKELKQKKNVEYKLEKVQLLVRDVNDEICGEFKKYGIELILE